MVASIIDRFLGRVAHVQSNPTVSITSLGTTAYASGDVVNNGAMLELSCVTHAKGDAVRLRAISVYENAGTAGTRAKAPLRLYVYDAIAGVAAQNTPWIAPTGATSLVGVFDIAGSDYVETADGSPDNYATALVDGAAASVSGSDILQTNGARHLYLVVVANGTPTFATGATLTFRFHFGE